jgi:hypothetical protein
MMQINFDQPQFNRALRSVLFVIFLLSGIALSAQTFSSTSSYNRTSEPAISTQQQQSYQSYQSTVYEPFDNTLPSAVGADGQEFGVPSNRRNLSGGGDPGTQGGSPVGEPWVLLFFAAAAAVVIRLRRKNVKTTI